MKKSLVLSALFSLWLMPVWAEDEASEKETIIVEDTQISEAANKKETIIKMEPIIVEDTQISEPARSRLIISERARRGLCLTVAIY